VNVSFIGVPPRDVRLADQREMPVADLPPAQIRVPDHAEIEPLDVTIADAGGHLPPNWSASDATAAPKSRTANATFRVSPRTTRIWPFIRPQIDEY
jgi:hypothetical protein